MTRAAVVWSESAGVQCVGLSETTDTIASRSSEAQIFLSDQTVSRSPHAAFRCVSGDFFVEHLRSGVMPTLVNEAVIEGPCRLADQDSVRIGSTVLVFHDLSAHDRRSAMVQCGFCNAENDDRRSECWRCGENLANARSAVYEVMRVECRIVPSSGEPVDLFVDDAFALNSGEATTGGGPRNPTDARATIEVHSDGSFLRPGPYPQDCLVNGQPARDGQPLKTGDTVTMGGATTIMIVRR